MAPRYASVAGLSLLITFGLFFAMQALIAIDELDIAEPSSPFTLDTVRILKDTEPEKKKRELVKPKPQEVPPQISDFVLPKLGTGDQVVGLRTLGPEPSVGDEGLSLERDTEAVPVVRVSPTYPPRMASRGIEGWVELEFSIGKVGNVVNPRVTASSNPGFDRAALRAVRGWRYNPKIEDGEPVVRDGIRVRLSFALDSASA